MYNGYLAAGLQHVRRLCLGDDSLILLMLLRAWQRCPADVLHVGQRHFWVLPAQGICQRHAVCLVLCGG